VNIIEFDFRATREKFFCYFKIHWECRSTLFEGQILKLNLHLFAGGERISLEEEKSPKWLKSEKHNLPRGHGHKLEIQQPQKLNRKQQELNTTAITKRPSPNQKLLPEYPAYGIPKQCFSLKCSFHGFPSSILIHAKSCPRMTWLKECKCFLKL
jgi:hypothetical protein